MSPIADNLVQGAAQTTMGVETQQLVASSRADLYERISHSDVHDGTRHAGAAMDNPVILLSLL
jgi:hypothetical protein